MYGHVSFPKISTGMDRLLLRLALTPTASRLQSYITWIVFAVATSRPRWSLSSERHQCAPLTGPPEGRTPSGSARARQSDTTLTSAATAITAAELM